MRHEIVNLNKTLKEYKFLCGNNIDSPQELVSFIGEKREQISDLEKERQSIYNRNRHKKSEKLNAQAREISARIKPLRAELSLAKAVLEKMSYTRSPYDLCIIQRDFRLKLNGRRKPPL